MLFNLSWSETGDNDDNVSIVMTSAGGRFSGDVSYRRSEAILQCYEEARFKTAATTHP